MSLGDVSLLILPCFFVIAFLYSSVGHGGASGYLAVFALFGFASRTVAPVVLVLNIAAASIAFIAYHRAGHFSWRLLLPFIATSIPFSFLGAQVHVSSVIFSAILGVALFLAAVRLLFLQQIRGTRADLSQRSVWIIGCCVGAVLGFVSGMIGIGGGIFLSPLLLFLRWTDVKQTAAISSAFIVLNSISGLGGHIAAGNIPLENMALSLAVVITGSIAGSFTAVSMIPPVRLQLLLGLVLLVASGKLFAVLIAG